MDVTAGDAALAYALTGRGGVTALDTGRPLAGSGNQALEGALDEILSGSTVHGGALLAPFGVRYVVADPSQLPASASAILGRQVDLDVVPASGLAIYRNAAAMPPAAILKVDDAAQAHILAGTAGDTAVLSPVPAVPMTPVQGGWDGPAANGLASISTEYSGLWQVAGTDAEPQRAFGWSTAFTDSRGPVSVRYGAQWVRSFEIALMAVLWAAALWITRKPVRR
jgi:hypothetical protein